MGMSCPAAALGQEECFWGAGPAGITPALPAHSRLARGSWDHPQGALACRPPAALVPGRSQPVRSSWVLPAALPRVPSRCPCQGMGRCPSVAARACSPYACRPGWNKSLFRCIRSRKVPCLHSGSAPGWHGLLFLWPLPNLGGVGDGIPHRTHPCWQGTTAGIHPVCHMTGAARESL